MQQSIRRQISWASALCLHIILRLFVPAQSQCFISSPCPVCECDDFMGGCAPKPDGSSCPENSGSCDILAGFDGNDCKTYSGPAAEGVCFGASCATGGIFFLDTRCNAPTTLHTCGSAACRRNCPVGQSSINFEMTDACFVNQPQVNCGAHTCTSIVKGVNSGDGRQCMGYSENPTRWCDGDATCESTSTGICDARGAAVTVIATCSDSRCTAPSACSAGASVSGIQAAFCLTDRPDSDCPAISCAGIVKAKFGNTCERFDNAGGGYCEGSGFCASEAGVQKCIDLGNTGTPFQSCGSSECFKPGSCNPGDPVNNWDTRAELCLLNAASSSCAAPPCQSYLYGVNGASCERYTTPSSGYCDENGACSGVSIAVCDAIAARTAVATCNSAACVNPSACTQGSTSFPTPAAFCRTNAASDSCPTLSCSSYLSGAMSDGRTCGRYTDRGGFCDGNSNCLTLSPANCAAQSVVAASYACGSAECFIANACSAGAAVSGLTSISQMCAVSANTAACPKPSCELIIAGFSADGRTCRRYEVPTTGYCDSAATCTTSTSFCPSIASTTTYATCGSASCARSCVAGSSTALYPTLREICFVDGESCGSGMACDNSGTCVSIGIPNPPPAPSLAPSPAPAPVPQPEPSPVAQPQESQGQSPFSSEPSPVGQPVATPVAPPVSLTPQLPPVVPPPVCAAPLPQPPGSVCQGNVWVLNVTANDFITRFGSSAPSAASAPSTSTNSSNNTSAPTTAPIVIILIDSSTRVIVNGVLNLTNTQLTFGVSGISSGLIRLDDCGSTISGNLALVVSSQISDQRLVELVSTSSGCLTETLSDTVQVTRTPGANPSCELISARKVSQPTGIAVLFTVDKSPCNTPFIGQQSAVPLTELAIIDSQLNMAAIAGGSVGGAVFLLVVGIIIVVIVRKHRQRALSREMELAKNRIESLSKDTSPKPPKPAGLLHRLSLAFKSNALVKSHNEVPLSPLPNLGERDSFLPPVESPAADPTAIILHPDPNKTARRAAIIASPDVIQTYMPDSNELESTFAPPENGDNSQNGGKRRAIGGAIRPEDIWGTYEQEEEQIDYAPYDP